MNALDLLNGYLREVERRWRLSSAARGLAVLAGVALVATGHFLNMRSHLPAQQ